MRKLLLATTLAASISTTFAPAHAFEIVYDPSLWLQNVIQYVKEGAHWIEEISWYKRQYDVADRTWNAVSHVTDLGSAASALGGLTRNFMPEANAIPQLMSDASTLWGSAGSHQAHDLYYQSKILNKWGDRWTDEMERNMMVTSNAKAMAEASSLNAEDHLIKLDILRARLESAVDITEVSAVNGLIALEQQNLQVHEAQTQNVALLMAADERVIRQRDEQMQRESADLLFMSTSPIGDLR
jgi:hypothetical protein